jgi:hypothetical protein
MPTFDKVFKEAGIVPISKSLFMNIGTHKIYTSI